MVIVLRCDSFSDFHCNKLNIMAGGEKKKHKRRWHHNTSCRLAASLHLWLLLLQEIKDMACVQFLSWQRTSLWERRSIIAVCTTMFYLHGDEKSVHFCETQTSRHGGMGFSYSQGRSDCVILKWRNMNMPAGKKSVRTLFVHHVSTHMHAWCTVHTYIHTFSLIRSRHGHKMAITQKSEQAHRVIREDSKISKPQVHQVLLV